MAGKDLLDETGVNAVAVARGGIANPWIFRECIALAAGEPLPPPPSVAEKGEVIATHFDECVKIAGDRVVKTVIIELDGKMAMLVMPATWRIRWRVWSSSSAMRCRWAASVSGSRI